MHCVIILFRPLWKRNTLPQNAFQSFLLSPLLINTVLPGPKISSSAVQSFVACGAHPSLKTSLLLSVKHYELICLIVVFTLLTLGSFRDLAPRTYSQGPCYPQVAAQCPRCAGGSGFYWIILSIVVAVAKTRTLWGSELACLCMLPCGARAPASQLAETTHPSSYRTDKFEEKYACSEPLSGCATATFLSSTSVGYHSKIVSRR